MTKKLLIKGAQVVTMDESLGDFPAADILVEDGVISAVKPSLERTDAEVIDGSNAIALPGIVDAHNCLWQTVLRGSVPNLWEGSYFTHLLPLRKKYRPEDNFNAAYIGGLEMLSYGTTTVVDYCHNVRGPGYAEASVRALRETGIRHVFTYSFMSAQPDQFAGTDERIADAREIHAAFHNPDSLTTVNFGIDSFGAPELERQLAFARELNSPSCIHVNGMNVIHELQSRGLLRSDLLAIHGNLITNAELELMADAKMAICFTPSADVQGTPADVVRRARDRGVEIVFGCDVPSHVASDTLGQLRIMFNVQGFLDGAMERSFASVAGRRPPIRPGLPLLTPRELLETATIRTARVLGLSDKIGSLTPGKRADLILVDKGPFGDSVEEDACAHVMLQTTPRDIKAVVVDGNIRMKNGALINFDPARVAEMMRESRKAILG